MNRMLLAFTEAAGSHLVAGRNTAALTALNCARSCRNLPADDAAALDAIIGDLWKQFATRPVRAKAIV